MPEEPDAIADLLADPRYLAQVEAHNLFDVIVDAAYALEDNGYAGAEVGPDTLVLYWKGRLPSAITDIMSHSRVQVTVRQCSYSREEMLATLEELVDNLPAAIADAGIVQAGPSRDKNAIDILTMDPIAPQSAKPAEFNGIPLRYQSGGRRGIALPLRVDPSHGRLRQPESSNGRTGRRRSARLRRRAPGSPSRLPG